MSSVIGLETAWRLTVTRKRGLCKSAVAGGERELHAPDRAFVTCDYWSECLLR